MTAPDPSVASPVPGHEELRNSLQGVREQHSPSLESQDSVTSCGTAARMETKMRKRVLTVLGVLFITTLTIQTATAAAHHARKTARAPVPLTQQVRDSHALSAPAAVHTRSCDIFACYED